MIETKIHRLKLKHAWTISRNTSQFKDNVFVKLEKGGITGLGEAAPNIRYGESDELTISRINEAKYIFEKNDWLNYKKINDDLDKIILDQSCAKAALDMALLDWNSKVKNVSLNRFLGLGLGKTPPTSFSIGLDSPDIIHQKIKEAKDLPILKIKLGTNGDEIIIKTIREITNKPIRIDANEGWRSKEEALEKIQWLEQQNVELVEQPLPATMIDETSWLRENSNLPIIADEAVKNAEDIPRIAHAYDGINIKLMKSGGIQEAIKMIQLAKAYNLQIMLGCMIESPLAISAAAHLASLVDWLDLDGNLLIDNDPFSGVKVSNGKIEYTNRLGIGVVDNFNNL
jgi:L-alanine-DL-glutamate epimerase-like enolase superfamily enzyme